MIKVAKWWLVVALISIAPIALADRDRGGCDPRHPDKRCQQVPEGGSTAIYLIGAGLISLGAMVVRARSRASKPSVS
jgi:hypothetical protein